MLTQAEFIKYLMSLAEEGETPLLVKQVPVLDGIGDLQFHADGAIVCTWPAILPTAKIKPDTAIYGNTGSFIVDRLKRGKPSASSANCEYVLVMMLDDVGDPAKTTKTPSLEPTWIMETSEGSFQWGYVFSEQPTKGQYSAAIKAIANAGYCDVGATNAVRNFRLPGSVNLKPNKNGFKSRLVELNALNEYTLDEICTALDVEPSEADTADYRAIRLTDTGDDSVVKWLSDNGLVLTKPNSEGWMGVVCPNSAHHTDGNPEGRYKPLERSYCCLHSHCIDLKSKEFLEWVAHNGGPTENVGLRDELFTEAMTKIKDTLTPNEIYPDVAQDVIAEVEAAELGRLEKKDWYARFAYLQNEDAYFDLEKRKDISRRAFTAIYRHIPCVSLHGNGKIKVDPATCYDENRQAHNGKVLAGMTYAAGEGVLVHRHGEIYGNRWVDCRPDVSHVADADVTPWLKHCQSLVPESKELNHILDIMAYKVQNANQKINHAVLHAGSEGVGKDLMWLPFMWAVGGPSLLNRAMLDGDTINSAWGYHLESEILVLNELKEPDGGLRRQLANRLKPVVAAPPEYLTITRKGLHPYDSLNRVFVLAFSNDSIPISLPTEDRRWFCVWSHNAPMGGSAGRKLYEWYKSGGFEAVASYLWSRDVSAFNPGDAPPVTEFRLSLIENSRSTAEAFLVEMMRDRRGEFASGIVGAPFHKLADRMTGLMPSGTKVPLAALLHAFKEAGWVDAGRVCSAKYPSKKQIFCVPEIANGWNKSMMREFIEGHDAPPESNVINFKG